MTETKTFHVGDIISVTSGRLVAPRLMDAMYDLLNWLTNDALMTHQLFRASQECRGFLRETFPDLVSIEVPPFDGPDTKKTQVFTWLDEVVAEHGETREVPRLPAGNHEQINPLTDLPSSTPIVVLPAFPA